MEEDDQIVHELSLDDQLQAEATLDIFKADPEYEANERKYADVRKEILGESSSDEDDSEDDSDEDESSDEEDGGGGAMNAEQQAIEDQTETNLVNLRRTSTSLSQPSARFRGSWSQADEDSPATRSRGGDLHDAHGMLLQERTFSCTTACWLRGFASSIRCMRSYLTRCPEAVLHHPSTAWRRTSSETSQSFLLISFHRRHLVDMPGVSPAHGGGAASHRRRASHQDPLPRAL